MRPAIGTGRRANFDLYSESKADRRELRDLPDERTCQYSHPFVGCPDTAIAAVERLL